MSRTTQIAPKAQMASLTQLLLARQMTKAGFITKIIMIETGLTHKQLRRIYSGFEQDEGTGPRKNHATMRSGTTLIHNSATKIQASLLMQLYYNLGGDDVTISVQIPELVKAFRLYHTLRNEIPSMKNGRWPSFTITDAWCLASELRSEMASLSVCNSCKCSYFTSVNQRTYIECPFCHDAARLPMNEPAKMIAA